MRGNRDASPAVVAAAQEEERIRRSLVDYAPQIVDAALVRFVERWALSLPAPVVTAIDAQRGQLTRTEFLLERLARALIETE